MKPIFNDICGNVTTYERPEGKLTVKYAYDFFKKENLNEMSVTNIS